VTNEWLIPATVQFLITTFDAIPRVRCESARSRRSATGSGLVANNRWSEPTNASLPRKDAFGLWPHARTRRDNGPGAGVMTQESDNVRNWIGPTKLKDREPRQPSWASVSPHLGEGRQAW
jgi:hypothetical protein